MTALVEAPTPLLEADPGLPVAWHTHLRVTHAGRLVLGGRDDHVARNGVDRWIGGVHLCGRAVPWRWDAGTESLTTGPAPGPSGGGPRAEPG